MLIEKKLSELGIALPTPPQPAASYLPTKTVGNLVYISGQLPNIDNEQKYKGKLGQEYTREEGYQAAKLCGLNLLAQLKSALGDLDRVNQIVHIKGFVAGTADFYDQAFVINGASDLFAEVFGESGKHTRCALGTNVLPFNVPVEVELIAEISDS